MIVYTYAKARQNLAQLLDRAEREGEVLIKRKDGRVFVVKPKPRTGSPFAVEGIDLDITTTEIVEFVQEGRRAFSS